MPKRGKKKARKIKFYKKNLKIPEAQNKMLRQFCRENNTTENKVFRKALRDFLQLNVHHVGHVHHVSDPNQLMLFDFVIEENTLVIMQPKADPNQLMLFDEFVEEDSLTGS
jgi:hypothetical protein